MTSAHLFHGGVGFGHTLPEIGRLVSVSVSGGGASFCDAARQGRSRGQDIVNSLSRGLKYTDTHTRYSHIH